MNTLQDSLDKLKECIEDSMPAEAVAIIHQATKYLKDKGIANGILQKGGKAPQFIFKNHNLTHFSYAN